MLRAASASKTVHDFYKKYAIPADSFARCVLFAMSQPEDVDVNEILFRPTSQELRLPHLPGLPPSASFSSINGRTRRWIKEEITNAPSVVGCPTG